METPRAPPREGRVRQFDGRTGEYITEYESAEAASAASGASLAGVRRALEGFQLKAAGFRWTRADSPPPLPVKRTCAARLRHDLFPVTPAADVHMGFHPATRSTVDVHTPPLFTPVGHAPTFDDLLSVVCAVEPFHEPATLLTQIRAIMRVHGVLPSDIRVRRWRGSGSMSGVKRVQSNHLLGMPCRASR